MKKIVVVGFLFIVSLLNAQEAGNKFVIQNENPSVQKTVTLSGVLNIDSKIAFDQTKNLNPNIAIDISQSKKSPIVAAGLSLLIPGAGEFYSERYLKSAVFVAVEAAAILIGLAYDKKGNDQTTFFQGFADQHWSVDRYAKWTVKNATKITSGIDAALLNVYETNGKVNWDKLNKLESAIGSYYSHRLPYYGEQQYFELIGKYPQFNVGWDDFGDENTPFTYDPTRSNLTARFVYYSEERGKANDYYNVATKAVVVIVVNHLISAIDAAWSAHNYNKDLEVHASLEKFQDGLTSYYFPQLHLQYRF